MHHTQRAAGFGFIVSTVVLTSATALLLPAADASAQGRRRTRVSADLAERVRGGDTIDSSVIVTGTQAGVEAIAAKHGLRIRSASSLVQCSMFPPVVLPASPRIPALMPCRPTMPCTRTWA